MSDETIMPFDFPQDNPTIIKVSGVGGGGGNAVNHMYKEGIHDVTFVVCNTDNQALAESPVPVKLQLGKEGLGAGNRPARAREAAEESIEDVKHMRCKHSQHNRQKQAGQILKGQCVKVAKTIHKGTAP